MVDALVLFNINIKMTTKKKGLCPSLCYLKKYQRPSYWTDLEDVFPSNHNSTLLQMVVFEQNEEPPGG